MVDYVLKYQTGKLIIIYCEYSKLLGTAENVVQNFIKLIRDIGSGVVATTRQNSTCS